MNCGSCIQISSSCNCPIPYTSFNIDWQKPLIAMRAQRSKIFGHGLVLRERGVVVYVGICKDDYGIDQQECT